MVWREPPEPAQIHTFRDLLRTSTLYAPRMPADPLARSEMTRSCILSPRAMLFLAHWGGPQRGDPGPQEGGSKSRRGPIGPHWGERLRRLWGPRAQGGPSGPLGKGAFGALEAHGGHWDDSEAIPNGMFSRSREIRKAGARP